MATRRQRAKKAKRRHDHTKLVQNRSQPPVEAYEPEPELDPVPTEEVEAASVADLPVSLRVRAVNTLENLSLVSQILGVLMWLVSTLFHRGHTGALAGAAVCMLGFGLFWLAMLTSRQLRLNFRSDPIFVVTVFCALISPSVGLALGAWTQWWIGLVSGALLMIGGLAVGIFQDPEK